MIRRTTLKRWLIRRAMTLGILLGVYLVLMFPLGCGRVLADKLLLHPSTHPQAAYGATEQFVDTPVGRVQIWRSVSTSAIGRPPERFVLRINGNAARAEWEATPTAARWGNVPTEVWSMNYPGFGGSKGSASLDKLVPAASAVWNAIGETAGDRPVFLDGDSMGTTVALSLAANRRADRPPAGLVLKNPPPLRQLIIERFGWWNLWLAAWPVASAVPDELDSIDNAGRSHAPAIFLRATGDTLIPPALQKRISDAYAGRVTIVELQGANHDTPLSSEDQAAIAEAIEQFR